MTIKIELKNCIKNILFSGQTSMRSRLSHFLGNKQLFFYITLKLAGKFRISHQQCSHFDQKIPFPNLDPFQTILQYFDLSVPLLKGLIIFFVEGCFGDGSEELTLG